ncbi:hypothetical protein [Mesorhizobium sp. M0040]|uniref:hypothetical protein n=1 Tax=Mesorhizobium sp. M0040 TaxID=2956855 RepID=UPI00333628F7
MNNHVLNVLTTSATVLVLSVLVSAQATASPTSIASSSYINATNSQVLGDDLDPNQLWVLPPNSGDVASTDAQTAAPKSTCESVAKVSTSLEQIRTQLDVAFQQQLNVITSIDPNADAAKQDAAQKKYELLQKILEQGKDRIERDYSQFAVMDGGFAHILFKDNWDDNIAKLKSDNPTKLVSPVETQKLRMYFAIPGTDKGKFDLTGIPLFKAYTVQGQTFDMQTSQDSNLAMSDSLGVDLQLTALGACYLGYPSLFGSDVKPRFALATTFQYPRSYKLNVSAKYNIWQIYKYFSESGEKGGLFQSSSYSNTVEKNWGDSVFSIDWNDQDPNSQMTAEERRTATNEIKAQLLIDLAQLATLKVGNGAVPAGTPGKSGAAVLSDSLMKSCAFNTGCLATAISFKVLDAVFGSSKSSTSYQKDLNVTAEYKFTSQSTRMVTSGTNFAVK